MPATPQQLEEFRRTILTSAGYDPDQYDFDRTTGEVRPRTAPATQTSALGAAAANAAYNIPEAATGLLGGVLGGAALGSIAGPPGTIIGGIAGGFGAPMLASPALKRIKDAVLPEAATKYVEQAQAEHPIASEIGAVGANLIGMKPSVGNIMTAGRGVRSLAAGVPWGRLSAAQRVAMPNVALGAGLGAGVNAAQQMAQSQAPDLGGKIADINPLSVAISGAGGAVLNEPNRIGRTIGLHATPSTDTGNIVPPIGERGAYIPTAESALPESWRALNDALGRKEGVEMQYKPEVFDNGETGTPVAVEGRWDPATDPTRAAIAQISESIGSYDAPPHEIIHGIINDLRNGTPAERAFAERALASFGGEEGLTLAAGKDFAGRFTGNQESIWKDLGSLMRDRFLRRGTQTDYARLLANLLQRQGGKAERTGAELTYTGDTPQAVAAQPPAPEIMEALRKAGIGDVSPEDAPQMIADIQDALKKPAAKRAKDAAGLTRAIMNARASLELLPPDQRESALVNIATMERKKLILESAEKVIAKKQELDLGSRTGEAPKPEATDARPPLDIGERTYEDTGFEGFKPTPPPEPPIEHAPWEQQGGDYPEPEPFQSEIPSGQHEQIPLARSPLSPRDQLLRAAGFDTPTPTKGVEPIEADSPAGRSIEASQEGPKGAERAALQGYAEDASVRYKRPASRFGAKQDQVDELPRRVGLNPFAGESTKLARAGSPEHQKLAAKFDEVLNRVRAYRGKYANPLIGAFSDLRSPEAQARLYEILVDENASGRSARGSISDPNMLRAYDTVRATLKQMATDQIAAGQPVWAAGGKRTRGVNPTYFPNVVDGGVRRILSEGQATKAFQSLRKDFIDHQMTVAGVSQAEAIKRFDKLQGSFAKSTAGNPFDFQAVRIQEGIGLPDSWIEADPVRAMRTYASRFSRDRASWDVLETDPHTMRMLGSPTYMGDVKIPANVTGPNLVKDPQVQRLVDSLVGRNTEDEPLISGATRLASAAIIGGPHTKIADILTAPFRALTYTAPGHMMDVVKGIFASPEGYKNAFTTGLNRKGGLVVAQDILGFGEQLNTKMVTMAEAITKYSGAEALELVSRGISQAVGENIGATHQRLAAGGDAKSLEFLKSLGADLKTDRAELGTRIAQLLQGRYDATNLPHWITHGKLAPFFGLMRWSAEQTNNFMRYAVNPALQGDFRPLIVSLAAGLTGGAMINEIRELVSGKKQQSASWAELQAGVGQPGFADALTYKALAAAQVTGTAGLLSELVKQTYEYATSRNPQAFNYPALNIVGDVSSRTIAAVRAIGEGGDAGDIIMQATVDALRRNVQAYRLLHNHLGRLGVNTDAAEELRRSDAARDYSVWQRMQGKGTSAPITPPIDYTRLDERRFDKAPIGDAAKMVPGLIRQAVTQSNGDVVELQKRLGQLKSIKPYGMPSPKSNPIDFARYYAWLSRTQGPDVAARVAREYMTRAAETEVKRGLVPTIGGSGH